MLDLGKLADVFAGESAAAFSPATRGVAEGDSADGEVSVYLGQLEQVYETSLQPLYETDEDGEPVYSFNDETGEAELVPLLDEDGQPMYAEQPLLDEDGQPVPVLDDLGNPVYEKVQLVDADGGAIVEYDEDGRPVAAVDEHGEPIYLLDEDGEKIPELDDAGVIVYERDPETGEDVLDGEGNRIPVWQVQAVEEAQVATLEAVGCVSAGDTPVVSMGFDSAAVMGSAGWGDALRRTTGDLSAMIREYGDGVLVCREGNAVGALVNADGSFDVVAVEWDDDGVPTAGTALNRVRSYGMEVNDSEGNLVASFRDYGIRIGGAGRPYLTIDSGGMSLFGADGAPANSVNSDETWAELDIAPSSAASFYVPAEAIATMELRIAGNFVPTPESMYDERERYGSLSMAQEQALIAPMRLFKRAPGSMRITGRDSEGEVQSVFVGILSPGDRADAVAPYAYGYLLSASYERGTDGQSLLYDELVLSREEGAYVVRRFGMDLLAEDPERRWFSDERTQMALDGYRLPGLVADWDIAKEGAWNNGLVPSWYSNPGSMGHALLSTFAHPLELNYYRCTVGDYPTTRLLAINPYYDPSCQTNRDSFAGIDDVAGFVELALYGGDIAGGFHGAPVYYPLATPRIEVVDSTWRWPTLPVRPLDSNGYLVELSYSTPEEDGFYIEDKLHEDWDYIDEETGRPVWDRQEAVRAVKVRWKAGTLDARLAEKVGLDDLPDLAVTGVKGAAEDSYRRGDVEIDEGDIGLGRLGETDIDAIIALAG